MQADEHGAHFSAKLLLKGRRLTSDYRHVEAAFAQASRDLHPDEARAENYCPRTAFRLREYRLRLCTAAQKEDVAEVGTWNVGSLRHATCSEQGRVVAEHSAIRTGNAARFGIDGAHLGGDPLDPLVAVKGLAL
jgi:hypothetical protein